MREIEPAIKGKLFKLAAGLILVFLYCLIAKLQMIILMSLFSMVVLYIDITSKYDKKMQDILEIIFKNFICTADKNEDLSLSVCSQFFIGCLITITLFEKNLAITAIVVFAFADLLSVVASKGVKNDNATTNKEMIVAMAFAVSSIFISILCFFLMGFRSSFFIIVCASFASSLIYLLNEKKKVSVHLLCAPTYCLVTFFLGLGL